MTDSTNPAHGRSSRLPIPFGILLVVVCAIWGAQQVAIKIGNSEIAPVFQAGLRSLGATFLLTLWFVWREQPPWKMGVRLWEAIALGSLFTFDFSLLFIGLDQSTASRGTILYYTGPILIAVGAALLLPSERIDRTGVFGFVLAFFGVTVILWKNGNAEAGGNILGDMLCLAAASAWAATILLIKTTRLVEVPATAALYFQLAGSSILLPALSLALGEAWQLPKTITPIAALGFQIVIVAFASYLVFFWMLKRYAASTLSAYSFLAPVFGVLFGGVILGETISTSFGFGAVLVLIGLVLVTKDR